MSVMGSEVNRLLKKIKDGDLTKREELFKITAGHLLGVARRYLYHAEDAEDVVAETFVRAFRYIHAYDESRKAITGCARSHSIWRLIITNSIRPKRELP